MLEPPLPASLSAWASRTSPPASWETPPHSFHPGGAFWVPQRSPPGLAQPGPSPHCQPHFPPKVPGPGPQQASTFGLMDRMHIASDFTGQKQIGEKVSAAPNPRGHCKPLWATLPGHPRVSSPRMTNVCRLLSEPQHHTWHPSLWLGMPPSCTSSSHPPRGPSSGYLESPRVLTSGFRGVTVEPEPTGLS